MWAADPPTDSATATARSCARGTRDRDLAARLTSIEAELETNSAALQRAARSHTLATVNASNYRLSTVSGDEVKTIYGNQLGRSGRPATKVRNRLLSAGPYGLCCYCQYGQATTLDHFVPKDFVPTLAIDPWNLVPACSRCNHKLLAYTSTRPSEQFLHPYAMPEIGRWLYAEIVEENPISVRFEARPDVTLDAELAQRVVNEFDTLDLALLFSVASGPDIAEMNSQLTGRFPSGSGHLVRLHLLDAASAARNGNPNGRRAAVFDAMADSDFYRDGAYALTVPEP